MSDVHPLLFAAAQARDAAKTAIKKIIIETKGDPPPFLSTVAINLWSPYLAFGRHTDLAYPNDTEGKNLKIKFGKGQLELVFGRYLRLMGRNLSPNHLLVEIKGVQELIINLNKQEFEGPTQKKTGEMSFSLPVFKSTNNPVVNELIPPLRYREWVKWLQDSDYESRYENLLREELEACRNSARRELRETPEAFVGHLAEWVRRGWVHETVGLSDFDDRWLSRLQLTALASYFWGPVWVTQRLSLDHPAQDKLELLVTCTVTGRGNDLGIDSNHPNRVQVKSFARRCFKLAMQFMKAALQKPLDTLEKYDIGQADLEDKVSLVGDDFSGILGKALIGSDHESKPIKLRGLLTPGLDWLPSISPTQLRVLHEIKPEEVRLQKDYWELWKAFFKSNDLFLSNDGVALHFELTLSDFDTKPLPIPRHVVQLTGRLESFIKNMGKPPAGLLQIGFEAGMTTAFHVRASKQNGVAIDQRIQLKTSKPFTWKSSEVYGNNWKVLSDALGEILLYIRDHTGYKPFFKEASESLRSLSKNQIHVLSDAIAEVSRIERGCLVFIGPLYANTRDYKYCFYDGSIKKRIDITRLGIYLPIVSQIPDSFAQEFRERFADLAGMDGETVVSTGKEQIGSKARLPQGYSIRPAGSLLGRQFIQLPEDTPPLVDTHMPKIQKDYDKSWNQASVSLETFNLDDLEANRLKYRSILRSEKEDDNKLKRSDLLSLGTRHRKAAMTTKCLPSILGITSSASGYIMVWLHGVPLVYLRPQRDYLLPYLQKPALEINQG